LDRPAFTTDIIVGFPGETDADFEATCRVVREVGFAKIHVFPFSPRRGTPAARYPDTVPPSLVRERRECLAALGREQATTYARSLFGRRVGVLVGGADRRRQGFVRGTSCRSVRVAFEGWAPALVRRLVPVRVVAAAADGMLLGRPDLEIEERRLALPLAQAPVSVQS